MHQGQLPRIVELKTRDALARRCEGWCGKPLQLPPIDKRLKNVLLDVEVVVIDCGELVA